MMASDTQKYFTLKYKKGLISDGWFARCRNTNYLGEMALYSAYALLAQERLPWCVLSYVWGLVFLTNMAKKEISLRKKAGWEEYKKKSNLLLPKLF
mmetsp:Transcript_18024/g.25355  ORF Transcript_18024/g.25355 Transcript_18024/m.25355 type:complete len:96 (+) Transcript_18024:2-289(+)